MSNFDFVTRGRQTGASLEQLRAEFQAMPPEQKAEILGAFDKLRLAAAAHRARLAEAEALRAIARARLTPT